MIGIESNAATNNTLKTTLFTEGQEKDVPVLNNKYVKKYVIIRIKSCIVTTL